MLCRLIVLALAVDLAVTEPAQRDTALVRRATLELRVVALRRTRPDKHDQHAT